jgi:glycine/D-amino acid oxidase-like deaminating enzyme
MCTAEFKTLVSAYHNGGVAYIIPRPGPDGTVLLGGTFQTHNWDTSYDAETADQIFACCAALEPRLLDKEKVRVLSHNVGLRPAREGGPRVEIEWMNLPLDGSLVPRPDGAIPKERKVMVLHAYGFG